MIFIEKMIVAFILLIPLWVFLIAVALVIFGICLRKKHKISSCILFIAAGVMASQMTIILVWIFWPQSKIIETKDGKMEISPMQISKYERYLENGNKEAMRKFIEKHPEMIYYYDFNMVTLLDYGMYNLDIELMQIAIDNGAVFDEKLTYDHLIFENSFDSFFNRLDYPRWEKEVEHTPGETTDEIIDTVKFMIEHGASLEYENADENEPQNFLEEAEEWVMSDDVLSDKDRELLELIEKYSEEVNSFEYN